MFVDPDARHPKEMCWIAQRIWRPVQDVRVDSRYSPSARKKVNGSMLVAVDRRRRRRRRAASSSPTTAPAQYCEVIEFYDIKRDKVSTFALDGDGHRRQRSGS